MKLTNWIEDLSRTEWSKRHPSNAGRFGAALHLASRP